MIHKADLENQVEVLTGQLEEERDRVAKLSGQLVTERAIGGLADLARAELATPFEQGLIASEATNAAKVAVVNAERERLTRELSESLQREKYDEFAADVRITDGPAIIDNLRELFAADGTFERIKQEAQAGTRREIQQSVLSQAQAEANAELDKPEVQEKIRTELTAEIAESATMSDYREQVRAASEEAWRDEIEQEVKDEIDAEEAAREPEFRLQYADKYRAMKKVDDYRSQKRKALEKEWTNATAEEVDRQIDDEELHALILKKAELVKAELEREVLSKGLLSKFVGRGINMEEVAENSVVIVYLGDLVQFEETEKYRDTFGYDKTRKKQTSGVQCSRILTLASLGGGRFVVDDDSLLEAKSEYERDNAIKRGTVISIGRSIKENGSSTLEKRIAADVPLYYDDGSQVGITDARYAVANISIDGVSAREGLKVVTD